MTIEGSDHIFQAYNVYQEKRDAILKAEFAGRKIPQLYRARQSTGRR